MSTDYGYDNLRCFADANLATDTSHQARTRLRDFNPAQCLWKAYYRLHPAKGVGLWCDRDGCCERQILRLRRDSRPC
jgi:hypothetical protein